VYYTLRGGKLEGSFRPAKLPPAKRMPAAADLFPTGSDFKQPAQRELTMVVAQDRWLQALAAAVARDAATGARGGTANREAVRWIAVSQPDAGSWLDLFPDGGRAQTIASGVFGLSLQRRGGLPLSLAAAAFDEREARGEVVTPVQRLGDELANAGEYNRRHNKVLNSTYRTVQAGSAGAIVLGDKEDPAKTAPLNEGHVLDLAELGAREDGGDVIYEIKVPSPLYKKGLKGLGSPANGGCWGAVGHLYGLGNTEEKYRVMVLGAKPRGRKQDGPFVHSTGKGWVKGAVGQYADALKKRHSVVPVIIEVFGSISEHTRAHFRHLAERSKGPGAIDRTRYGQLRGSTRSFRRHHLQQLVKAAVVGDSEAILRQITSLKQRAFGAAPARLPAAPFATLGPKPRRCRSSCVL